MTARDGLLCGLFACVLTGMFAFWFGHDAGRNQGFKNGLRWAHDNANERGYGQYELNPRTGEVMFIWREPKPKTQDH